jgi:transcriptional regulator with GAF, ATPase, and Fis domain
MVTVNVGGLSEGVFESEMFGHVKAFTDARPTASAGSEMAEGGTLFLDEIANLPIKHQPKLLRVLETENSNELDRQRLAAQRRDHLGDNADLAKRFRPAASVRTCCSGSHSRDSPSAAS